MTDSLVLGVGALVFGAILGSFINALSFRLHTGRGIGGRSRCMHCNATLHAQDLIPVFSYLWLRGCCRFCGTHISSQYPLVEVAAALLSFGVYVLNPTPIAYGFWLLVWMVILLIVIYDLRHRIIPWSCSALLLVLAGLFVLSQLSTSSGTATLLSWSVFAGPILAFPLLFLSLISSGRWMGWGDGIFELALGWLLGLAQGLTALTLAVWSGAFVGLLLITYAHLPWRRGSEGFRMNSEIPFAPFLALGAVLAYFLHVDFFINLSFFW